MRNEVQNSPVMCCGVWDTKADLCERWVGVQLYGRGTPGPVWPPGRALLWATAAAGCAAGRGSGPGAFPPRGEPWGSTGLCSVLLGQEHRALGICHGNLLRKWENDWTSAIRFDWFHWLNFIITFITFINKSLKKKPYVTDHYLKIGPDDNDWLIVLYIIPLFTQEIYTWRFIQF